MASKISTQFSWILLGRIAAAGLQAITIVFLARTLGPQQFGILTATLGVTIVLQAISDLGIGRMLIREHSKKDAPDLVNGGLRVNSWSSLTLGFILVFGFILAGLFFDKVFFLMIPLAISVAAEKNADTWLGIAIAEGDARINFINLVSRRSITLVLFLLLNALGINALVSYTISVALAAICSVVFAHQIVSRWVGGDKAPLMRIIRTARPFWVNTLAIQLRNLDTVLVGFIANAGAAGYYSTAARLTSPLRMLPTSLASVMLPHVTKLRGTSIRPMLKLIFLAGSAIGVVYILLALVVPGMVPLLLGEPYRPAIVPLQIVLFGLIFASFSSLFGSVLQGRGSERGVAVISVVSTIYVLSSLVLFTFFWEERGAALALASGFIFESLGLFGLVIYSETRKSN